MSRTLRWRLAGIVAALALGMFNAPAHASKEGILTLDTFEARTPGIGASGPVAVSGSQDMHGVSRLVVTAFGKRMELDAALLDKLHGFHFNGMQMSYEAGYEELGGRTLYITLSKGFTSGTVSRKFLVITEDGAIKVRDDLR